MPSGGARKGAGRKPLLENKRKKYSFYLSEEENKALKSFLNEFREKNKAIRN